MKWLFYTLFAIGCLASLAAWGAPTRTQRKIYIALTIGIWILVLILANTIL